MAGKHSKMYDKSPKLERDSDGEVQVKKASDTPAKNGVGEDGSSDEMEGPAGDMARMHDRHHTEKKDMHKRHETEHKEMNKRHMKEMKKLAGTPDDGQAEETEE